MAKTVIFKKYSLAELTKYYDEYCLRYNIQKNTEKARKVKWAMCSVWRDGTEWVEHP